MARKKGTGEKELHKHYFISEVACKIGLIPSILFEYIYFWVAENERNEKEAVYKDDRYWTYGSVATLQSRFPYLSPKQVRSALDFLTKEGYILTGAYNLKAYDKTKWYTVSDKGYKLMQIAKEEQEDTSNKRKSYEEIDRVF